MTTRNPKEREALAGCHVSIIGCGSFGSALADMLVRAGLGRLTLIDPETLAPENIERHVLTPRDLGRPKAEALAARMAEINPALRVGAYFPGPEFWDSARADGAPAGVGTVVHVEAGWHAKDPLGPAEETRWMARLPFGLGGAPALGAIVVHADPTQPTFGALLDAHLAGIDVTDDGQVVVDEYQRTTARGIFALGDVSSPYQLKHVANHESRVVRENLLRDWDDTANLVRSDHRFVPSAVFTEPQIATVGLTEAEAREAGYDIVTKVQDYGDTAYGWAMEDTTGIAKLIGDRATGRILGAHIMGYQASSIIQPLIQAMSFGLTAPEMARGQYWIHPALPELVENALLGLE